MATPASSAHFGRTPQPFSAGKSLPSAMGNKIPRGYEHGQLGQFTPEQMQLFQQLFGHVGPESFTSRLAAGEEGAFQQYEAPALRQFQKSLGQIGARYSGMGLGGQRSSAFQNELTGAGSELAERLAGQRLGLQRSAIDQLMSMSNQLLGQRPYEQFLTEEQTPFWQQLLLGLSGGLGQAAGSIGGAYGLKRLGL